jgi:molybdopterin-binding protein
VAKAQTKPKQAAIRVGEAAEVLGVSVDTLRRWASAGRRGVSRAMGRQRLIAMSEVRRLQADRRVKGARPIVAQSARNRFPGTVTKVERDRVAAVVEVQAGQFRIVSLMTAEAAEELAFRPGMPVVCVVKATNVVVEIARGAAPAG